MGVDLPSLVVGRREADDVAMARSTVEIVSVVEDDVFRRLDLSKSDDLDRSEPVIVREGASRLHRGRRGGGSST